jgi:tellurite resistance protein TerC
VLKYTAYILVLNIGIELILEEFGILSFNDWAKFGISIMTIILSLVYEQVRFMHRLRPLLVWIAQGFANFNEVIDWALVPIFGLFRLAWRLMKKLVPKPPLPPPGSKNEIGALPD